MLTTSSKINVSEVSVIGIIFVVSGLNYENVTVQQHKNGEIVLYADSPLQRFKFNLTTNTHWFAFLHNGIPGKEILYGKIGFINQHLCRSLVKDVEDFSRKEENYGPGSNRELVINVIQAAKKVFAK